MIKLSEKTIKKLKQIEKEIECDCNLASLKRPLEIKIKCRACGHVMYSTEMKK